MASSREGGAGRGEREVWARFLELLATMEETQANKVIALARRLKPGLTAEDIRNPHDFPDLDDPDWHFEDGQLAGIQAVRFAVSALANERHETEPAVQATLQGDGDRGSASTQRGNSEEEG